MNRNRNLLYESELSKNEPYVYHFTDSLGSLISILKSGELITADNFEFNKDGTLKKVKYKAELIDGVPRYGISLTRNFHIYINGTKAFAYGVELDNQKLLKVFDTIAFNHFSATYEPDKPAYKKYVKGQAGFQHRIVKFIQFDLTVPEDGAVIQLVSFPAMRVNQFLSENLRVGLESIQQGEDLTDINNKLGIFLMYGYKDISNRLSDAKLKSCLESNIEYKMLETSSLEFVARDYPSTSRAFKEYKELQKQFLEIISKLCEQELKNFTYYESDYFYGDEDRPVNFDFDTSSADARTLDKLKVEVLNFLTNKEPAAKPKNGWSSHLFGSVPDAAHIKNIGSKIKSKTHKAFSGDILDSRTVEFNHKYEYLGNFNSKKADVDVESASSPLGISLKSLFLQGFLSLNKEEIESLIKPKTNFSGNSVLFTIMHELHNEPSQFEISKLVGKLRGRSYNTTDTENILRELNDQYEKYIDFLSDLISKINNNELKSTDNTEEWEIYFSKQREFFNKLLSYRNSILDLQDEAEERILFNPEVFLSDKTVDIDGETYEMKALGRLEEIDAKGNVIKVPSHLHFGKKGNIETSGLNSAYRFSLKIEPFLNRIILSPWEKKLFECYLNYCENYPDTTLDSISKEFKARKLRESELQEFVLRAELNRYLGEEGFKSELRDLETVYNATNQDLSKWQTVVKPKYLRMSNKYIVEESYNNKDIRHVSMSFKKYGL